MGSRQKREPKVRVTVVIAHGFDIDDVCEAVSRVPGVSHVVGPIEVVDLDPLPTDGGAQEEQEQDGE